MPFISMELFIFIEISIKMIDKLEWLLEYLSWVSKAEASKLLIRTEISPNIVSKKCLIFVPSITVKLFKM